MSFPRWVITLVIALMLIDFWVGRAEATSIGPNCGSVETPFPALPLDGPSGEPW